MFVATLFSQALPLSCRQVVAPTFASNYIDQSSKIFSRPTVKKLSSNEQPQNDFVLSLLKKIDPTAYVYKKPRDNHLYDATIFRFSFLDKDYGLKLYEDRWANSLNIYRRKWIPKINETHCATKVLASFTTKTTNLKEARRYVLYEYQEGRPIKWSEMLQPENTLKVAKIFKTFSDMGLCVGTPEINNFILTPDQRIVLTDWDTLRITEKPLKPKQIYYSSIGYLKKLTRH
jgi:hypothetical protein